MGQGAPGAGVFENLDYVRVKIIICLFAYHTLKIKKNCVDIEKVVYYFTNLKR